MDHERETPLWAELSLLLAVVFLGTNPVAVKYAVSQVPPLPFVALRFTAAGLLLLGISRLLKTGAGSSGGTSSPWRGWGSSAWASTTWPSPSA